MSNTKNIIKGITGEIAKEREAQEARWGQQDHPSSHSELDIKRAEKNANRWKQINDARVADDTLTWDGILLEEVWEALAEKDDVLRRAELVQVAAVAAAEIEAIDRRFQALEPLPVSVSESLCERTDCLEDCGGEREDCPRNEVESDE